MGMKNYYVLCILTFFISALPCNLFSQKKSVSLALLDPTGREKIVYQPFLENAEQAGFNVHYHGVDDLLNEQNMLQHFSEQYDAILLILEIESLRGINTHSPLMNKILTFLDYFSHQKNKLLGIIFPRLVAKPAFENMIQRFYPIFFKIDKNFGPHLLSFPQKITTSAQDKTSYDDFLFVTNKFLSIPLESRVTYHTTLRPPHQGLTFYDTQIRQILGSNNDLHTLPLINGPNLSKQLNATLPYGIYWVNPETHNAFFVSSKTILSFSGMEENFLFCPTNFSLRKKMNTASLHMLQDMYQLFTKTKPLNKKNAPQFVFGLQIKKANPSSLKKTAWMEIPIFEPSHYNKKLSKQEQQHAIKTRAQQQNLLIKYIFESGLDSLWISMTPNIYYSPIAKYKDKEKDFLSSISLFTSLLQKGSKKYKAPIPKIFVGFEIANNLYGENTPKNYACDLYGNTYPDVPAPLNNDFWNNEVKIPLTTFIEKWNLHANKVPLSGVMLDLEMYGRKTSNIFLTTMGFEDQTFQRFLNDNSLKITAATIHDKINFLSTKKLATSYFSFLEAQAQQLGNDLRTFFTGAISDCQIGCYAPSLFPHWFYKGLWRGLSTSTRPIHLFTFNSEFNTYKKWFDENKIYAHHSGVLLLSKIMKKKDFKWVQYLFKHHNGIWLNRFSRLVERYDQKSWIHIEQTPLQKKGMDEFLRHIKKIP
ncbi:MAG: hypothetical protein V1855_01770 [bacterium]